MGKEKLEFVKRIESHYVGNDCLQIMTPYQLKNGFTMLNADGMTYHYKPNSNLFINKYTSDERRKQFPYSNIPNHKSRVGLKKLEYANQLLDFNKVYIEIKNGIIIETFAIKDGDEGLVATKLILPNQEVKYMNRDEIMELFKSGNVGLFSFDGGYYSHGLELVTEERILEWYKEQLIARRKQEQNYYHGDGTSSEITEFFYKSLNRMTIDDVPSDISLHNDIILISTENGEINSVKAIQVKFMGVDNYKVEIYDFPITVYSLEHMTKLEQTSSRKTSEPKFPKSLNKAIDKQEIKQARQLVLSKKKS